MVCRSKDWIQPISTMQNGQTPQTVDKHPQSSSSVLRASLNPGPHCTTIQKGLENLRAFLFPRNPQSTRGSGHRGGGYQPARMRQNAGFLTGPCLFSLFCGGYYRPQPLVFQRVSAAILFYIMHTSCQKQPVYASNPAGLDRPPLGAGKRRLPFRSAFRKPDIQKGAATSAMWRRLRQMEHPELATTCRRNSVQTAVINLTKKSAAVIRGRNRFISLSDS